MEWVSDLWDFVSDWPIGTILFIVLCLFAIFIVFLVAEFAGSHVETIHVTVVEKSYTPSSTGVGVGPSMGGNGGVAVVVTSNPEKHILFVQQKNSEPFPVNVSRHTWLTAEKGKAFDLQVRVGWLTGSILD